MTETNLNFESFEPRVQQAIVFSLFEGLRDGEFFNIQNSSDPVSLYNELTTLKIPSMKWEYLEKGPETWRIRVSKSAIEKKHEHGCCGVCGGH